MTHTRVCAAAHFGGYMTCLNCTGSYGLQCYRKFKPEHELNWDSNGQYAWEWIWTKVMKDNALLMSQHYQYFPSITTNTPNINYLAPQTGGKKSRYGLEIWRELPGVFYWVNIYHIPQRNVLQHLCFGPIMQLCKWIRSKRQAWQIIYSTPSLDEEVVSQGQFPSSLLLNPNPDKVQHGLLN